MTILLGSPVSRDTVRSLVSLLKLFILTTSLLPLPVLQSYTMIDRKYFNRLSNWTPLYPLLKFICSPSFDRLG